MAPSQTGWSDLEAAEEGRGTLVDDCSSPRSLARSGGIATDAKLGRSDANAWHVCPEGWEEVLSRDGAEGCKVVEAVVQTQG